MTESAEPETKETPMKVEEPPVKDEVAPELETKETPMKVEEPPVKDEAAPEPETKETPMKVEEPPVKDEAAPKVVKEIPAKEIEAVAQRLKFFYSDANLRSDKYMKDEMRNSEDNCVHLEKLMRFNSLKKCTTNPAALVQAVETSEILKGLVFLNKTKTGIGRVNGFTVKNARDNVPYTIILKNLPFEDKKYSVTVDDIKESLNGYGDIVLVRMRYHRKDAPGVSGPKGEAFVEFEKLEDASKAIDELVPPPLEQDEPKSSDETKVTENTEEIKPKHKPKKELTIKGSAVEVESMKAWIEAKEEKKRAEGTASSGSKRPSQNGGKSDDIVVDWKPGCVVQIKGLPGECDREAIMKAVKDYDPDPDRRTLFIDFSRGQTEGALRFKEPGDKVKELAEKLAKGEITIMDAKVESAVALEGEEESKYWDNVKQWKQRQHKQVNSRGGYAARKKRPRYH